MTTAKHQEEEEDTIPQAQPRRLRKVETVLSSRTSRIILVLERCYDSHNHQAVLRTAECFGIQHVYVIQPFTAKTKGHGLNANEKVARQATSWISIRNFATSTACIEALR